MSEHSPSPAEPGGKRGLVLAGVAVVAIAAIGAFFVLPAEFGIDPTGFGEKSGLTEIANPKAGEAMARAARRTGVFTPSAAALPAEPGARDHWTYELQPYEEIELKYVLNKGALMVFAWSADGPLNVDMHAHPFEGGEALTESYAVTKAERQSGRYVAAFSGIHGWHWQNRGLTPVRLTLDASGQIKGSRLIDGRTERERALTP
jgi:hypothetical protein